MSTFYFSFIRLLQLLLCVFCLSNINAQTGPTEAIRETFAKQYPLADSIELKYWNAVYFKQDGHLHMASYTKKGKWKQTSIVIDYYELPTAVKESFEKSKYHSWTYKSAARLLLPGAKEKYRVRVQKGALREKYLLFDVQGNKTALH